MQERASVGVTGLSVFLRKALLASAPWAPYSPWDGTGARIWMITPQDVVRRLLCILSLSSRCCLVPYV